MILLLIMVFFSSCGEMFPKDHVEAPRQYFKTSDPFFDPYKANFESDFYIESGRSISTAYIPINITSELYFEDNPSVLGACFFVTKKGTRHSQEILINKKQWDKKSEVCKKYVVYHELGHCALSRTHTDSHLSIMNSTDSKCSEFYRHSGFLLEELFTMSQNSINYLKDFL